MYGLSTINFCLIQFSTRITSLSLDRFVIFPSFGNAETGREEMTSSWHVLALNKLVYLKSPEIAIIQILQRTWITNWSKVKWEGRNFNPGL